MSKRKKTPNLPSMDDLLSPGTQAPRSQGVQESNKDEERIKVTYYLPPDLVDRIDEAHFKIGRMTRGSDIKIHKYDMARVAWKIILAEFEEDSKDNELVRQLFSGA